MDNESNRDQENRAPQQEQERKSNTLKERGEQREGPPDTHELDKNEGKMENGELGGNLRKEE